MPDRQGRRELTLRYRDVRGARMRVREAPIRSQKCMIYVVWPMY